VQIGLVEYATRAVYDDAKGMAGRTFDLTGFLSAGPDGRPMLTRMVLSCCAADGRPIKIGMIGDVPGNLPADTWVQVRGSYTSQTEKDPVNEAQVPYVEVQGWQQVTAPRQQYE
jgi:uncharacterized repeat protein (TIGR03943 family)